jgi:hypothetical protein
LERVLQHYRHLSQLYGMRSGTMLEVARDSSASRRVGTAESRATPAADEVPARGTVRSRSPRERAGLPEKVAHG